MKNYDDLFAEFIVAEISKSKMSRKSFCEKAQISVSSYYLFTSRTEKTRSGKPTGIRLVNFMSYLSALNLSLVDFQHYISTRSTQ